MNEFSSVMKVNFSKLQKTILFINPKWIVASFISDFYCVILLWVSEDLSLI